ncbi:hypothetical protein BRIN106911_05825 [Brevibacillus invocatus]
METEKMHLACEVVTKEWKVVGMSITAPVIQKRLSTFC